LAGDKEFVRKQVSVYLSLLVRRKNIIWSTPSLTS
jgi:hypothetical protein